ncbi:hypothetical protein Tco_0169493, partial [Tanacetum coccineum]
RKDTEIPQSSGPTDNVADEAVYEEMDDSLERAATTTTSLDAEQERCNINKTQSKATLNEPSSLGTSSGSSPRCQETIGDIIAQTRSENRLQRPSLKRRVKKLERRNKSRTHGLKRLYKVSSSRRVESSNEEGVGEEDASKQGRIADIDADAGITLDSTHFDADRDMFEVHDLDGDEVIVDNKDVVTTADETRSVIEEVTAVIIPISSTTTTTTTTAITDVEMTLTQALAELKSAKPKADKVVIQEPKQGTTTPTLTTTTDATTITAVSTRPRAKGLVIHEQEQAPTPTLAQRLQAQEQEELTDEEKEKLFVQFLEQNDGDDVTIDATHLSTKSLTIVNYKIYKEGKKSYFQIIRVDGNSKLYLTFGKMLKNFNKEDLEVLWSIVKTRFKKTEPVNYMDNFLLLNLKTMFEHHVEDNVWKNQQGLVKVLNWKLYDSCGVHCVTMQNMLFYLLVEKMYPLTNHTLHQMFNDVKLQVDYECEMAFELLRLIKKQLKEGYGRIVGIKRLYDDLEVTNAKLMLLVYKFLLLVLEVNVASTKVTTAQRLRLLKEFLLSRDG